VAAVSEILPGAEDTALAFSARIVYTFLEIETNRRIKP
jgi:hypothetical protein